MVAQKPSTRIVSYADISSSEFFDFARIVHPRDSSIVERLSWFAFKNPLSKKNTETAGLFATTADGKIAGQFLMCPTEFIASEQCFSGFFGYDFFVREEYRAHALGALLFIQGVRQHSVFLGAGLTPAVEAIASAAGLKTLGYLKKFLWIRQPAALGLHAIQGRFKKQNGPLDSPAPLPLVVNVAGVSFKKIEQLPDQFKISTNPLSQCLQTARTREFLDWRFFTAPFQYGFYTAHIDGQIVYVVVRSIVHKGMRFLVVVDYYPHKDNAITLTHQAAKAIARGLKLDGVVTIATCLSVEKTLRQEFFMLAGRPSAIIASVPKERKWPDDLTVSLTMADADLELSFTHDS